MASATTDIVAEVASWPEVELVEGRFRSTRFMVGRRELGHLHGSSALDIPLPKGLKAKLVERGEAEPHRFTPPGSGWVTIRIGSAEDRQRALEILRERYQHALSLRRSRATVPPTA